MAGKAGDRMGAPGSAGDDLKVGGSKVASLVCRFAGVDGSIVMWRPLPQAANQAACLQLQGRRPPILPRPGYSGGRAADRITSVSPVSINAIPPNRFAVSGSPSPHTPPATPNTGVM